MSTAQTITVAAKLRWVPKKPEEKMVIGNFEAVRLMCNAIILEKEAKLPEAQAFEQKAAAELERELHSYLSGIKHVPNFDTNFNMSSRHGLL